MSSKLLSHGFLFLRYLLTAAKEVLILRLAKFKVKSLGLKMFVSDITDAGKTKQRHDLGQPSEHQRLDDIV